MLALLRTVHVLSVSLWFGSVAFFTVAGVLLFGAFERESLKPAGERALWFPLPEEYAREPAPGGFPDPLRREQGSRAAGTAVSGIFPVYFATQAGCAAAAVLTALGLAWGRGGRLNGARVVVCVVGLGVVLCGWWLERQVHELREVRNAQTDEVLRARTLGGDKVARAVDARAEFGKWHGISLLANFATLALALALTVMAAHLPQARGPT